MNNLTFSIILSFFKPLFERKSAAGALSGAFNISSLPTKEQEAYFSHAQRMDYVNFSQADQNSVVSNIFNRRYDIYSTVQPVKTAIDYIALGCQSIPIVLKKRSKSSNKADEIVSKNDVLDCNFNAPSTIYNPSIDSLLQQIIKEYYLNGVYAIYYNKDSHIFYVVPNNQYSFTN